jgi:hypothetical protein
MANKTQKISGTPYKVIPQPQTPGQQQITGGIEQLLMNILGSIGQPVDLKPISEQAKTQFYQQTVPTLAERFTQLSGAKTSSPVFASTVGAAGAGLEQNLASMQAQYALNQKDMQSRLLSVLLGSAMAPHSFLYEEPQRQGFGSKLLGGLAQGIGGLGNVLGYGLPMAGVQGLAGLFGNKPQAQQPMNEQQRQNALAGLLSQIRGY